MGDPIIRTIVFGGLYWSPPIQGNYYIGIMGYTLLIYGDNGKETGNYRDYRRYIGIMGYILGLYRDNGKENGNYDNGLYRDYGVYIGVI